MQAKQAGKLVVGTEVQDVAVTEFFLLPIFIHECGVHVGVSMSACVGHVEELHVPVFIRMWEPDLVLVGMSLIFLPPYSLRRDLSVRPELVAMASFVN